jgi:hypothetical protein
VVEQLTCNEQVIRSNRIGGSILFLARAIFSNPNRCALRVVRLPTMFPADEFKDLTDANAQYIKEFKYSKLTGVAQKGLAIVTCMDSRINPLSVVGMRSGDAKILRNAGARVTEDVLRTLVLATYFWV